MWIYIWISIIYIYICTVNIYIYIYTYIDTILTSMHIQMCMYIYRHIISYAYYMCVHLVTQLSILASIHIWLLWLVLFSLWFLLSYCWGWWWAMSVCVLPKWWYPRENYVWWTTTHQIRLLPAFRHSPKIDSRTSFFGESSLPLSHYIITSAHPHGSGLCVPIYDPSRCSQFLFQGKILSISTSCP